MLRVRIWGGGGGERLEAERKGDMYFGNDQCLIRNSWDLQHKTHQSSFEHSPLKIHFLHKNDLEGKSNKVNSLSYESEFQHVIERRSDIKGQPHSPNQEAN